MKVQLGSSVQLVDNRSEKLGMRFIEDDAMAEHKRYASYQST